MIFFLRVQVQGSSITFPGTTKKTQRGEVTETEGSGYSSLTAEKNKEHRKESMRRTVLWTNV